MLEMPDKLFPPTNPTFPAPHTPTQFPFSPWASTPDRYMV